MRWLLDNPRSAHLVSTVILEAGGKIVGRTKLQKIFYLLTVAGYADEFSFEYRHYGPFSEELARAATMASVTGLIDEVEHSASWGGTYSVFISHGKADHVVDRAKQQLLDVANEANPIDLELAATAIFLASSFKGDPWEETIRRKPEKAKRIENARVLLHELRGISVPTPFPTF